MADRCPGRLGHGRDRSAGRGSLLHGSDTAIRKSVMRERNSMNRKGEWEVLSDGSGG